MGIGVGKTARSALLAGFALALLVWAASVSTPAASASACDRFGKSDPSKLHSDDARRAIVCLLNQRRDRAGLPDLRPDKQLDRAAPAAQRPHGWHGLLRPRLLRRKRPRPAAGARRLPGRRPDAVGLRREPRLGRGLAR